MLAEFTEQEQVVRILRGAQFDRERNGSLWDRGSADSYYGRGARPHWFPEGTGKGQRVEQLNELEQAEYHAGYDDNEQSGDKKDWG
jgi:hypothetical protein